MKIALLYEHPTWSNSLIETFQSNGIDLKLINVADLFFRTDKKRSDFNFAVNRINMMPSSGSGIAKFDAYDELKTAIKFDKVNLGIDGTGLVQEYIQSDGYVYRVEILGGRIFYSIKQKMMAHTFNYCAVDGCSVSQTPENKDSSFDYCALNQETRIQPFEADETIVAQVISIVHYAGADLGGVEYLMDTKTGTPCFYDFNPYSNFVSNGQALLGFSPEQRFVDYIKDTCSKRNFN